MADGAHVRLVNPHPEGVRGHDHPRLTGHEPLLGERTHAPGDTGMVGEHLLAERSGEQPRELFTGSARTRVDDRRQCARLRQGCCQAPLLIARASARHDREAQIGAIEAGRHPHGIPERQAPRDVVGHPWSGGRGQRDRGPRAEGASRVREREVIRPEVVAPLGHAMGLIDDEQPDPGVGDRFPEARQREPLGCHVEEPNLAAYRSGDGVGVRGAGPLRVDQLDATGDALAERLHLVLHQRHERRDDQGQVIAHQRRQLVAE